LLIYKNTLPGPIRKVKNIQKKV